MEYVTAMLGNSLALCLPIVALSAPLSALVLLHLRAKRRRHRRRKPP
jgi:hypothetical protein